MNEVPGPTVKRLVLYYNYLEALIEMGEKKIISSGQLGRAVGVQATQIRKDLSYFGALGCKGIGYEVESLKRSLEKIIGFNESRPVALIGAGNLGQALVYYDKFRELGLDIIEIFDCDLSKIGNLVRGIKVKSTKEMVEVIRNRGIRIAVISVPAEDAQTVSEELVEAGIKAIWNFAPIPLKLDNDIIVISEDLSTGIGSLFFKLKQIPLKTIQ